MQNSEWRKSMSDNVVENKSFDFAVRIVNLHKHLSSEKKEFVLSKQLLRSGTSIGANVSEALRGQSKADFLAKMSIALKEANESHYWIRLLYKTDFLTEQEFNSIENDIIELIKILSSICKTSTK
jgi:four helix bundle protein